MTKNRRLTHGAVDRLVPSKVGGVLDAKHPHLLTVVFSNGALQRQVDCVIRDPHWILGLITAPDLL